MTNKPGHPPAPWGKSTTMRIPEAMKDRIKAAVDKFKQSFNKPNNQEPVI